MRSQALWEEFDKIELWSKKIVVADKYLENCKLKYRLALVDSNNINNIVELQSKVAEAEIHVMQLHDQRRDTWAS